MAILRGANMGLHADPSNATHISKVLAADCGWFRTWSWAEYQWLCSTPDSTSSRGTLNTATSAGQLHHVFDTTPLNVLYPFLGVPRVCNPRCGTGAGSAGDGSYHRFAIGSAAIAQYAADAALVASAFFTGYEGRGVFCLWNEPQISSFSADQSYTPPGGSAGDQATAAAFAAMVGPAIAAVRAAVPGLPIGLELGAARGDMGSRGSGLSASYLGDTYALAVIDWLQQHRPDALPDVGLFHPYIYTTGWQAGVDSAGVLTSLPTTSKGWNGHLQMLSIVQGLQARNYPARDALLGTGGGPSRMSSKIIASEYGCPSREPAHDASGSRWFDEQFQSMHFDTEQQVIANLQAIGAYHPVSTRYTVIDTASPTASSATADLHDYFGPFRQSGNGKPSLATWQTWAGKVLVADPTDPPPVLPPSGPIVVPINPPAPSVSNARTGPASVYSVVGSGLLETGQQSDRCWTRDEQHPRLNACRGVVMLGGLGGWGPQASPGGLETPQSPQSWPAVVHALIARPGQPDGYTFLSVQGFHTSGPGWGCDDSLDAIQDAIDAFHANGILGGAKPGKVALVATSMGHVGAFNYAVRHPDRVAGVFGFNPASSLDYHWNGGVDNLLEPPGHGGTPTTIAIAYGLSTSPLAETLDATVRAQRDPVTRAAELADMPWGLSYGLADSVVGPESVEQFIVAKGGTSKFTYIRQTNNDPNLTGIGSHTMNYIEPPDLLAWLDTCNW